MRSPRRTGRTPSVRTATALCLLAVVSLLGAAQAQATSGGSPTVTITSAPPSVTTSTDATIAFTATSGGKPPGNLDEGRLAAWGGPATSTARPAGRTTFASRPPGLGRPGAAPARGNSSH